MKKEKRETRSITDMHGTMHIYDAETNEILSKMDKHGFIYNAKGKRTGHINDEEFIEGYHDID